MTNLFKGFALAAAAALLSSTAFASDFMDDCIAIASESDEVSDADALCGCLSDNGDSDLLSAMVESYENGDEPTDEMTALLESCS